MPVFDKLRVVNVSEQELDELFCGICHQIFVNPVVLRCCRQTYCKSCIKKRLKEHNTCPNNRHVHMYQELCPPSRALLNNLDNLKVHCLYRRFGCKEELIKSEFERHLKYCPFNTCETCRTRKVFGTEHNCLQVLKSTIDGLTQGNHRLSKDKTKIIEENQKLCEIFSKLKVINQTLGQTNQQLTQKCDKLEQKFSSICGDLRNENKTLTQKERISTEMNIGLKKEIEILRKNVMEFKNNSPFNPGLNFMQSLENRHLKVELDDLKSENLVLRGSLDFAKSEIDKMKDKEKKFKKIIELISFPLIYAFFLICLIFQFVRCVFKLCWSQVIWLKNFFFSVQIIYYSKNGSRIVDVIEPGIFPMLFQMRPRRIFLPHH